MKKKTAGFFAVYILLAVFVVVAVFPFLWMVSTSLKTNSAVFKIPPEIIPSKPDFSAYFAIWKNKGFFQAFFNSFKVASVTTICAMVISIMAGLGFARFDFRGQKKLQLLLLLAQLFPLVLLVTPYYTIMRKLDVIDEHMSLYLSYASFVIPFSVWMLTNYFRALPTELEEAALIDGSSTLGALIRITVPLSSPGIVATAINAFILSWNEFLFAQTFIDSPGLRTLPIALKSFMGQYSTEWNTLMAASVISTLPVVVMFIFLQRQLIAGMTSGAVKG